MSYGFIYALPIESEVEPGFFKLKWRPIKHTRETDGTWNIYCERYPCSFRKWGFESWDHGTHGYGHHRSWDGIAYRLCLWWFAIQFWVRWNVIVHKDGPSDVADDQRRPLDLSEWEKA